MIRSMTGFGRASLERNQQEVTMEIRSVNSRYFDVNIRSPRLFAAFEGDWRSRIKDDIGRGNIELRVNFQNSNEENLTIKVDAALAKAYLTAYRELCEVLSEVPPHHLNSYIASRQDVFTVEEELADEEDLKKLTLEVLEICLKDFNTMRETEGEALQQALERVLAEIERLRSELIQYADSVPDQYRVRLLKRVEDLLGEDKPEFYNGQRVAAEVALYADKADVTEELVRLQSHVEQFRSVLSAGGAVGKKLDFIIQEMNREANTVASKSQEVTMVQNAVELKSQIEQLREQVQNIE